MAKNDAFHSSCSHVSCARAATEVVTGVFLNTAIESAGADKDTVVGHCRRVVLSCLSGGPGILSVDEGLVMLTYD